MSRQPERNDTIRPQALTAKGVKTRQALLQAARSVFENRGYFQASISEMGRRCGVSQGTFYQYFRNKDQVFREVVDLALDSFWQEANRLPQDSAGQASLEAALRLLLEHCRRQAGLHRVLNEFELIETVSIGYFDSIARFYRDLFRKQTTRRLLRPLDPNVVAYSALGLAVFLQRDWSRVLPPVEGADLAGLATDLLLRGIGGNQPWRAPGDPAASHMAMQAESHLAWEGAEAAGKRTKLALFEAAEQVFGEVGYSRASIAEITKRAGVAQGTFYVHFASKEDLMNGVVRFLNRELRRELRHVTERVSDRRSKETEGMAAFFRFLRSHRLIYRIVSESEAIVPQSAAYYYERLAEGYCASLAPGVTAGQIRNLPMGFLVPALMGINHMIGLRWLVWSMATQPELPGQVLADVIDLVVNGLRPRTRARIK